MGHLSIQKLGLCIHLPGNLQIFLHMRQGRFPFHDEEFAAPLPRSSLHWGAILWRLKPDYLKASYIGALAHVSSKDKKSQKLPTTKYKALFSSQLAAKILPLR